MSATSDDLSLSNVPCLSGGADQFRLGWKAAAIVAAFGASLLLMSLGGDTRALTYHEVLFAQPAKEMLATGNGILPKFAGIPSTHKPPGAHWTIAGMMLLTGSEAEGWVRIPSALAGVITALIVAAMAARWFGSLVGLVAGLVQLTTYYVLQLARLAECDMLLIAAVTGAMSCFALAHIDSPRGRVQARWAPWLFYACASLAFLFKGFIGPAFIFPGCVLYLLVSQDLRGLKFFLNPVGLGLFLFCTIGWYSAAYLQYPPILEDQLMHHFGRFQGDMGGGKDPFYYIYSIPLITLPWTPLIVVGIIHGIRNGRHAEPLWRFAACWIVPGLTLLSVSAFKSKHYAAPLAPPLTVIAALSLLSYVRYRQRSDGKTHLILAALSVVGCLAGIAAVQWLLHRPTAAEKNVMSMLIVVIGAGLLLAAYCDFRRSRTASLTTLFATAWLVISGVFAFIIPYHDSYRGQAELAHRVNEAVPAGRELYLLNLPANGENQIAYYLTHSLKRIDELDRFGEALPEDVNEIYVLAPRSAVGELSRRGTIKILDDRCAARSKQPEHEQLILFTINRPDTASRRKLIKSSSTQ